MGFFLNLRGQRSPTRLRRSKTSVDAFPCPGVRPASGENGGVSVDQKWSNKGSDVQSKSIDSKRQKKTSCQI